MSKGWMPLYVGDYLGDTAHLSQGQHGAYLLLLMHYWQRGSLPGDIEQCCCIARAMDEQSRCNVNAVLDEFFVQQGSRYRQRRMDDELKKSQEAYERRAGAAKKRWRHAKQEQCTSKSNKQSNSIPCGCDSSVVVDPDLNQDIENEIREIAALHPKVKDPLHIPTDICNLVGEAIFRDGRDLVWSGTKTYHEAVKAWPVSERQLAVSPQKFFRESVYLTDPREWERKTNGTGKPVSPAEARSDRSKQNILDGFAANARRADAPDGVEREVGTTKRTGSGV